MTCANHVTQDDQRDDKTGGAAHMRNVGGLCTRNELQQAAEHQELGQVKAHNAHGLNRTRYQLLP